MTSVVFVSSSVMDLRHIRDRVRSTLRNLSMIPVMSDYGEIPYMGQTSAEEFCYQTVNDCQIMVLIIGKRYGSNSKLNPDTSVTETEFRTARGKINYLITFIDREVYEAKKIYDANRDKEINFPGMDNPVKTFAFIQDVMDSKCNNGIIPFSNADEVDEQLRKQLAALFGRLLKNKAIDDSYGIKEIIGELQGLKSAILTNSEDKVEVAKKITRGVKFLLEDQNRDFSVFVRRIGEIDKVILSTSSSLDFKSFLTSYEIKIEIKERLGVARLEGESQTSLGNYIYATTFVPIDEIFDKADENRFPVAEVVWRNSKDVLVNQRAYKYFERKFSALKDAIVDSFSEG